MINTLVPNCHLATSCVCLSAVAELHLIDLFEETIIPEHLLFGKWHSIAVLLCAYVVIETDYHNFFEFDRVINLVCLCVIL
ncbi:hypothetical protein GDO86_015875 [Hymenochirus boettgeri]|uniref:Uncharacterized protein n=1 Tax=Hymenochirus boettgeri TaxID=247094 RepID=A0A8T2K0N2_9PIPI|nr:hypothetical protein GDO86_015875 [Hymenochirus boettgeri]